MYTHYIIYQSVIMHINMYIYIYRHTCIHAYIQIYIYIYIFVPTIVLGFPYDTCHVWRNKATDHPPRSQLPPADHPGQRSWHPRPVRYLQGGAPPVMGKP